MRGEQQHQDRNVQENRLNGLFVAAHRFALFPSQMLNLICCQQYIEGIQYELLRLIIPYMSEISSLSRLELV